MPLRAHHVSPRSTALRRPFRPVADVPFDDLVVRLAAGVADAQTALDTRAAETAASLAETDVKVVPSMTRTIDSEGAVTVEAAAPERRSLLELGIKPAWYRFGETTIEVDVDVSASDDAWADADDADTADSNADRLDATRGFRAGTQSVIDRRRFDRTAGTNARLVARLEPTPIPVRVDSTDLAEGARGGDRAD
ncbi:hypothetical protein [Halorubrum sp. HHNYT27]|uniref:hypothetical protein n=1 Tax=Halorubrum sp. HHNYT27 TaxID=3402275 RepID=UPI003EB9C5B9